MGFTVVAVVAGVVFGFLAGGRPSNVHRRSLELVWLLAASVVLQASAEAFDLPDRVGLALVLVSYVGLTAFAIANSRLVGMPVVLVGLLCNLVAIALNGGMPVEEDAILASRAASAAEIDHLDFGAKRHLASDDDVVRPLGDIIPVRPTREVISFGDLIMAFGIADVIFRLLKPVELRRRHDDAVIDLDRPSTLRSAPRQLVDA